MGVPREALPVKPIFGILAASVELLQAAHTALNEQFGVVELTSEPERWTVSSYYCREMGEEIWRQYVALSELMAPGELPAWKITANALEQRWVGERGRAVNLDPGYVAFDKVVLASTKDAAHRVYVGRGIYAEATLRFVRGSFEPWPYSYRDYASPQALGFFNRVRERYRRQIAERRSRPCA